MARVLISGAGIAGPSLAYWLLRDGFEVTLVEHAPRFRDSGYMIDVWGIGYDMLERMGVLNEALRQGYAFKEIRLVGADGRTVATVEADVFADALGGRLFSIPRGDLARIVFERVEKAVTMKYSTSIVQLHPNGGGVDVELSNGENATWDIVVGADGVHSRVRELILGSQKGLERYLGYCAASFSVDRYPHRDERAFVTFARPGRQISRYSLRGGRTVFLLVVAQDGPARMSLHDLAGRKRLLHERFAADGWECPEILRLLERTEDLYFDTVTQVKAQAWSEGRVVLLGDAAYCPSLLAGAGAAYAMLGAHVVAAELRHAGADFAAAFRRYEQQLRPFMNSQQDSAARFASAFAPKTMLGLHARNLALRLMRLKPLGRWYARRAFDPRLAIPSYA